MQENLQEMVSQKSILYLCESLENSLYIFLHSFL